MYEYVQPTARSRRHLEEQLSVNNTPKAPSCVLIVDDNEDILTAGRLLLKRHGHEVTTSHRAETIPDLINETSFDAILLDMNFALGERSGREGFHWLERILQYDADAVVVLITAYGSVDVAVEAIKRGATDFIVKPWRNERLLATVKTAVSLRQSRRETETLRSRTKELAAQSARPDWQILGNSQAIRDVMSFVDRAAPTDANVLILGENGTGKELVARELHRRSNRSSEIFMSVDLGSVAETLFESELFGHRKGAFTDAKEDRIGRFQAADGGTLFLDEIGNLPLHLQAKLLTVLEQRQVTPVGANRAVPFDVRMISATNMPVDTLTKESVFRPDLLYRLNTVEIVLPPLRDRRDDIPILAGHFARHYARKYGREEKPLSEEAVEHLTDYDWPGNIRALRHAVERAVILSRTDELEPADFVLTQASAAGRRGDGHDTLNLEALEKGAIERALRKNRGNISHAARDLGVTRASLYRRMDKHGL